MSITDGTILRVVASLIWTDGEIVQNVFNIVISGGGAPWDEDDVVADAIDWVEAMFAEIVTYLSTDIDGSQVQVYEYDPIDDDWDEVGSDSWVYDPTGATEPLPRGVAGLINAKTTDPDISGKKYIGGLVEGSVIGSLLEAGVVADLILLAALWTTGFTGNLTTATWTPVVWSIVNKVAQQLSGAVIVPTIPAYQRRRKQGVGI